MAYITAKEVYNYITGRMKSQTFTNKPVLASYHVTYNTQTGINPNGKSVSNSGNRVTRDETFNIGTKGYCIDGATRLIFRNQWNVRKAENERIPVTYVLSGTGTASKFKAGDVLTGDAIFSQLLDYKFKWSDAKGSKVFSGLQGVTRRYGTTFTDTFQGKTISYTGNKSDGSFKVQLPTPSPTSSFTITDFNNGQVSVGANEYKCIRGWGYGCRQFGYAWTNYATFNPRTGSGLVDNSKVTNPVTHTPNNSFEITGTTRTVATNVSQINLTPAPKWTGYCRSAIFKASSYSYRCSSSASYEFSARPFGSFRRKRESDGGYRCTGTWSYGYYIIDTSKLNNKLSVSFTIPSAPYGAKLSYSGLPSGSTVSGNTVTIPVQRGRTYSGISFQFKTTHMDFKDSAKYTLPKIVVGA